MVTVPAAEPLGVAEGPLETESEAAVSLSLPFCEFASRKIEGEENMSNISNIIAVKEIVHPDKLKVNEKCFGEGVRLD